MSEKIKNQFRSSIEKSNLETFPYKFVDCRNIFERDEYNLLLSEFPNKNLFGPDISKNNFMISIGQDKLFSNSSDQISYKNLFNYICSKEFFLFMVKKFNLNSYIENELGLNLSELSFGIEGKEYNKRPDFLLDCRLGINTANNKVSSVREAHIDSTAVLYTGMLYLRDNFDVSTGSNFIIYKPKNESLKITTGRSVSKSYLEKVTEIPYEGNNMVVFNNSLNSVHAVSPRSITPYFRKFIAFNATYKEPLFNLISEKSNIISRILRKIKI